MVKSSKWELRRIETEDLTPLAFTGYIETGIEPLVETLAFRDPVVFYGPKGAGKTLALEEYCAKTEVPMVRENCHDETSVRDLVGRFNRDKNIYFQLGCLTTAIEVANTEGQCILVLEEINTLPPGVQKILNSLMDHRQEVNSVSIGHTFRVSPDSHLWIVGTMNPNYGGTYDLNEDLRSRTKFVEVSWMSPAKEKELLLSKFTTSAANAKERVAMSHLITLAGETRSNTGYALSTRDLLQVVDDYLVMGKMPLALKMLEQKFVQSENRIAFRARVSSAFSINLSSVKLY